MRELLSLASKTKISVFVLLPLIASFIFGCGLPSKSHCRPVLLPYVEYDYRAEIRQLAGSYNSAKGTKRIELQTLNIDIPDGWQYEASLKDTLQLRNGDKIFFIAYSQSQHFSNDANDFRFLGCAKPNFSKETTLKTSKEFYYDLYLFTSDQLSPEPIFWQYFILWSKSTYFHDIGKISFFKGKALDAFQKNIDPKLTCTTNILSQIIIFPKRSQTIYYTLNANFFDDLFFEAFLDMIDIVNQ